MTCHCGRELEEWEQTICEGCAMTDEQTKEELLAIAKALAKCRTSGADCEVAALIGEARRLLDKMESDESD
jgi:hypothetical protein